MASHGEFFERRKPAAAFKHGILSRYPVVFATKAGRRAAGGRVVFLDGYAGEGRYRDGSPGSPLLLAQTAAAKPVAARRVTALFVERDPATYRQLQAALAAEAPPELDYATFPGDLGAHLPTLLDRASGAALFVFLDPFGTTLSPQELCSLLNDHHRLAALEVLLHFSVLTVARTGGLLRKAQRGERALTAAEQKTVANVDRFLGGEWWHKAFQAIPDEHDEGAATEAAMTVANRYCRRVSELTGFRSISMPVRPGPGLLPKYVLVMFTRHDHGVWHFTDTLGQAGRDWVAATHAEQDRRDQDRIARKEASRGITPLFDLPPTPFDPDAYEAQHHALWTDGIASNLAHLLEQHGDFRLAEHPVEVYGEFLGQAWERHVKAAVKQLHAASTIHNNGVGRYFWQQPLRPTQIPFPRPSVDPTTRAGTPARPDRRPPEGKRRGPSTPDTGEPA